jgi:putative addiction module killer protein
MEAKERTIFTYETEEGRVPFNEWLEGLRDTKTQAIARTRINRVRLGNFGDCKSVGEGVVELRIDFGAGYRIYFGQEADTIILLAGGDKSTQDRDIARAKRYWEDYGSRQDEEETEEL